MIFIVIITLLQIATAYDLKGKVSIVNRTELTTDEFVDISIRLIPEDDYLTGTTTNERIVPRHKNGYFYIPNLEEKKYILVVQAPQIVEKTEMIVIENNTVHSKLYNKGQKLLNIRIHPIDFTEEKPAFSLLALNPMIIMSLVSIGLMFISKIGMNNISPEESRLMNHPDILLANGEKVDPTTLVPSFVPKSN